MARCLHNHNTYTNETETTLTCRKLQEACMWTGNEYSSSSERPTNK